MSFDDTERYARTRPRPIARYAPLVRQQHVRVRALARVLLSFGEIIRIIDGIRYNVDFTHSLESRDGSATYERSGELSTLASLCVQLVTTVLARH